MELERTRKMELLHTPKSELAKIMRQNSLTVEEVIFLFASKKLGGAEIRMNAPAICDKLLNTYLSEKVGKKEAAQEMSPPMFA